MVQVIGEGRTKPLTTSQKLGRGLSDAFGMYLQHAQQEKTLSQENEAAKRLGIDISGFTDPEMRKSLALQGLKSQGERQQQNIDLMQSGQDYDQIKNYFGENFANVWKAAPTGGKTELLKHAIDAKVRGYDVNELLSGVESPQSSHLEENKPEIPQMKKGKIPKSYKWEDYSIRPAGYTPKEWNEEKKTWRKENVPVFQENKNKLKSNARDALDIKRLGQLNKSKKLPEGLSRALINPQTGELWGIAQLGGAATPETQEYAKIFARFQNRAKDAFGSRVTNFDLAQYMKQFPGLLNTPEGRARILKMMAINNELDQLYENSLNKIYDHYGLGGIPQEKAEELAQSFIRDETKRLEDEYLQIDNENMMEGSNKEQKLSGRMVDVLGPDGQLYEIDESEIGQLPEGFLIQ